MASQNASIKLLIAWVYHPAVRHLVEALKVAANYYSANPKLEIIHNLFKCNIIKK